MRSFSLTTAFLLAPALTAAVSPLLPRSSYSSSSSLETVSTVFQLPAVGGWFENVAAVRRGGRRGSAGRSIVVATRLDVPEVWTVDPRTGAGSKLVELPGKLGVTGIRETGKKDVFVVAAGNYSLSSGELTPGSFSVYEIDLAGKGRRPDDDGDGKCSHDSPHNTPAAVTFIADLPSAMLPNGIELLPSSSSKVLISDSVAGVIWVLDTLTGNSSVALSDPTFAIAANSTATAPPVGVNGIHIQGSYLYYSSTSQALLGRIPIDTSTGRATGEAEVVATGVVGDDFVFSKDGKSVLLATNVGNTVVRIGISGEDTGTVTTVAGGLGSLELAGCTAMAWGVGSGDEDTLYVTTGGGLLAPVNGTGVEAGKVAALTF